MTKVICHICDNLVDQWVDVCLECASSDYAAALRIYKEWGDSDDISSHDGFFVWCKERLNARTQ